MMRGRPRSAAATRENVVPRSMPMILAMPTPPPLAACTLSPIALRVLGVLALLAIRNPWSRVVRPRSLALARSTRDDDLGVAQHPVAGEIAPQLLADHGPLRDTVGGLDGHREMPVRVERPAEARNRLHALALEERQEPPLDQLQALEPGFEGGPV